MKTKEEIRTRLHSRIRKKVAGTPQRPRLAVFRSQTHIYAQVIDDDQGKTLAAASSLDKDLKAEHKRGANVAAAKARGLRPRRVPVPRPHQGAGRRGPRRRTEVLMRGLGSALVMPTPQN